MFILMEILLLMISCIFFAACTSASTSFVTSASKPVATVSCTPQMIKHRENKKKKRSKSEFFLVCYSLVLSLLVNLFKGKYFHFFLTSCVHNCDVMLEV